MGVIATPLELRKILYADGMPAAPFLLATDNFRWDEVLRNQTEIPSLEVLNNLLSITKVLQRYRASLFNNKSITITSGWRSLNYNQKTPGASPRSYHIKGLALDFKVAGLTPLEVQRKLDFVHNGGLEFAPTWTHIDLGTKRRFDNKNNPYKDIKEFERKGA